MVGSSKSVLKGAWRPTKIMNMRDLSRDDDFLSHLLVEKLGTGGFPLVVHKMDPSRKLPKTDPEELMHIIRRLVVFKGPSQTAIRQAVDDLLSLMAVRYYVRSYTQKQINAFATHASRYFELYLPSGSIEIAHTSRYSHRTGKSELCILATRPLAPGTVISELKGSMADLTEEEDKELKGTDIGHPQGVGIRRDFSVIHSKQLKKNHLFLGPARFVNHDCDHNVELFREGRYITFRVIKHIGVGEEVTAHYGDGYFGRNNRHCLCHTCEVNERGGYAPHDDDDVSDSGSSPDGASSDNDESDWTTDHEDASAQVAAINVNERRTRRGVYAVLPDEEGDASDADVEVEGGVEPETTSELTSAPPSSASDLAIAGSSKPTGLLTPETETLPADSCSASAASTPRKATPVVTTFTISTRSQKARATSELGTASVRGSTTASVNISGKDKGKGKARTTVSRSTSVGRQLETPPLTSDNGSVAEGPSLRSSSRLRARGDAGSSASRVGTPVNDRKGKGPGSVQESAADLADLRGKAKEDSEFEGRSLRKRPVVPTPADVPNAAAKRPPDGPRGVDGKLLPTCMTCKNVLPVISVEDRVVWNGQPEKTGKRGRPRKQVNQECPRCMRHYAIYAVRWPERMPTDGTPAFFQTPRDNRSSTPAYLSHKNLAVLNHKLSNAASTSRAASVVEKPPIKRQHTVDADQVPPPKRQKVSVSDSIPVVANRQRGRPPKNKVGMSIKARELLGVNERRSGRARVPSLKLRESEPPSKGRSGVSSSSNAPLSTASTSSTSSSNSNVSTSSLTLPQSDANDRHLRSAGNAIPPEPTTPVSAKSEIAPKLPTPKSLAVASQPREANGRFGKKASTNGRYMRKNFHLTAGGRRMARGKRPKSRPKGHEEGRDAEDEVGYENVAMKQEEDEFTALGEGPSHPPKRSHDEAEEEEDRGKRRKMEWDEEEVSVKIEREEVDLSLTSNEDRSGSPDESEPQLFRRPRLTAMKSGAGLFSHPNPLTFARRKWISSVTPEDPEEEISERADPYGRLVSTDDDTDLPVTPEDGVDHGVVVVDESSHESHDDHDDELGNESEDSNDRVFVRPKLMVKAFKGPLTFKPNPLNMARRRWGPPSPAAVDPKESEDPSETHASSRPTAVGFTDLFETDLDQASVDDPTRGGVDPDVSSEEEGFRGPSILSVFKPGKPGRRSSSASSAILDLTDDSEQIVERLVSVSDPPVTGMDFRPSSAQSPPTPSSPQKSPSMTWKQTVLLPMNAPFHHSTAVTLTADISPAPTKLMRAGWDSGSSDETD